MLFADYLLMGDITVVCRGFLGERECLLFSGAARKVVFLAVRAPCVPTAAAKPAYKGERAKNKNKF